MHLKKDSYKTTKPIHIKKTKSEEHNPIIAYKWGQRARWSSYGAMKCWPCWNSGEHLWYQKKYWENYQYMKLSRGCSDDLYPASVCLECICIQISHFVINAPSDAINESITVLTVKLQMLFFMVWWTDHDFKCIFGHQPLSFRAILTLLTWRIMWIECYLYIFWTCVIKEKPTFISLWYRYLHCHLTGSSFCKKAENCMKYRKLSVYKKNLRSKCFLCWNTRHLSWRKLTDR